MSTLVWASAAHIVENFCVLGVIKFRKKARYHCEVPAVRNKNGNQRLINDARIPNTACDAPDPVALATAQSCARVNVDTNDPTFVSGVDIQVGLSKYVRT